MIAFISANIGKPQRTMLKFLSVPTFGHEVNPVGREV
jgi:hypothetical protein